ncbi:MAG: hypothetical protein R6V61_06850 [Wenzhouxiangellaceae bacterium]
MPVNQETVSTRRIVRVALALGVINLALILPLWWRDGAWGSAWLVPELGLLPLFALWPAARRSSVLPWTLAALLTLAVAALLGDAAVRAVFSRPLDILLDPWLLRAGFHLLDGSLGTSAAILAAVLAALAVVATALGLRALVRRLIRDVPQRAGRPIALLAVAALAGILLAPAGGTIRPALVGLVQNQSQQVRATLAEREALTARAGSERMQARPIPALAGRDVVIVFVESYGVSALDQPRYSETLDPVLARAEGTLSAAGLGAVSTRMQPPIRGGQSWLSHASALSGQPIDNDYWYSMLLDSGQDFLTDDLRLTGHTPLVVAPAIVRPWPEARALGFEAIYPAAALEYAGPKSGWVGIPDQYTLHRYSRHLRPRHPGPVFSVLLLISSHAPWSPGPPLLDDWSRLDAPDPWPDWTPPDNDPLAYWRDTDRLRDRYPESLACSLEAVFAWAARDLPEDALLIVLGDHQATPLITGHGAGADVPVHMISSDESLLARLLDRDSDGAAMSGGLALPPASSSSPGLETLRFALRRLQPDQQATGRSHSAALR